MTQDPVVKRVIAALERSLTDADAAEGAAYAVAPVARPARDAALDAAKALGAAYQSAAADLYAQGGARNCRTLADMLESDRPAVRLAAQLALEPTPTAPKHKR